MRQITRRLYMAYFLKGNYELAKTTTLARPEEAKPKSLTERMEESALAKLGGSVCFVVKKKTLLWLGDSDEAAG
jgi:hypothetical protein